MQYSVEKLPDGAYVVAPAGGPFIPAFFTDRDKAQHMADKLNTANVYDGATPRTPQSRPIRSQPPQ